MLQDAELAHTDADLVVASVTELEQLLTSGRADSLTVVEVVVELLSRLDALHDWAIEQAAEVTA